MKQETLSWLRDHVIEHDSSCTDIATTTHRCKECSPWLPAQLEDVDPIFQEFNANKQTLDYGINPYNFTSLCNLWTTVDIFKSICKEQNPKEDHLIELAISYASEILYKLSGRQYNGLCERIVSPGCVDNFPHNYHDSDTEYMRDRDYAIADCCDTGKDCGYDKLSLPGPINQVMEVVIDGRVLPRDQYKLLDHKYLVLTNGEKWPKYNDLSRSPYKQWPPRPTNSTMDTAQQSVTWLDEWKADSGFEEDVPLTSDWVLDFLARNPRIPFHEAESWVSIWLKDNGIEYKILPEGCDTECWIISPKMARQLNAQPANLCCSKDHAGKCGGRCGPQPSNLCCGKRCGKPNCGLGVLVYDPCLSTQCRSDDWVNQWLGEDAPVKSKKEDNWVNQYISDNKLTEVERATDLESRVVCCRDECLNYINPETGNYYFCVCNQIVEYVYEKCHGCSVPANSCVGNYITTPNVCCSCRKCKIEKPECTCGVPKYEYTKDDVSLEGAPWWARQHMFPDAYPKETSNLNTPEFIKWSRENLQNFDIDRPVQSWVMDYLDNHPCNTDVSAFSVIDEPYKPHCISYNWNTPDQSFVDEVNKMINYCYDPEKPAWTIRYYQGKEIPFSGQMAAIALAREILKGMCPNDCGIPSGAVQMSTGAGGLNSATFKFIDWRELSNMGLTGVFEADLFLTTVNPGRLRRAPKVYTAERIKRVMHNVR